MTPRLTPFFALFSLAATSLFAADAPNTLTDAEKADGWKLLFDGKTSAGWVALGKTAFPEGWTVEDGLLKHGKGGGDIVTTESYQNFEVTWDWNIAAVGNSGLKYNLPNPAKNVGFEFQLLDDEKHPDGIKGGRLHQTGGLYDLIEPPADKKVNPPGEWNSSRLLVSGNHVEHWLNGVKTVEFEIGSDDLKARIAKSKYAKVAGFGDKISSPILLQDHGDQISFRSMKIRVLPANRQSMDEQRLRDFMAADLADIATIRMPFGKFGPNHFPPRGVPLYELPVEYLAWFARKNCFPKGRLGELLRMVHQMKVDGLDIVFDELRRRAGGRTSLRPPPGQKKWHFPDDAEA